VLKKARRTVITSDLVQPGVGGKYRPKLWAYGYSDLADLFGLAEQSVRQAVSARRLDPSSLRSIVAFFGRTYTRRNV